jgi:hypothetical protein
MPRLSKAERFKEAIIEAIRRMPKPRNAKELEVLSKAVFGVELHMRDLHVYNHRSGATYTVEEDHDLYKHADPGYDVSEAFFDRCFGRMSCGGIGRANYGQTNCTYRDYKRISQFNKNSRRAGCSASERVLRSAAKLDRLRREHLERV